MSNIESFNSSKEQVPVGVEEPDVIGVEVLVTGHADQRLGIAKQDKVGKDGCGY